MITGLTKRLQGCGDKAQWQNDCFTFKTLKAGTKSKKKYSKMFLCYSLIFGQFVTVRFLCVVVSFWTVSDCIIAQS